MHIQVFAWYVIECVYNRLDDTVSMKMYEQTLPVLCPSRLNAGIFRRKKMPKKTKLHQVVHVVSLSPSGCGSLDLSEIVFLNSNVLFTKISQRSARHGEGLGLRLIGNMLACGATETAAVRLFAGACVLLSHKIGDTRIVRNSRNPRISENLYN